MVPTAFHFYHFYRLFNLSSGEQILKTIAFVFERAGEVEIFPAVASALRSGGRHNVLQLERADVRAVSARRVRVIRHLTRTGEAALIRQKE